MLKKRCEQCGIEYEVYPYEKDIRRFCSKECQYKWRSEDMRGENNPNYKNHKHRVKLLCEQCGGEYEVYPSRRGRSRFCSKECQYKWRSENIRGENNPLWKDKILKVCEQCGEEFEVWQSVKDIRRFCSRECYGKWMSDNQKGKNNHMYGITGENCPSWKGGNTVKICEQCGGEFEVKPSKESRSHFCSKECHDKWRSENIRGENHPLWKNGASFEPYCHKFNEAFKESIREKFGRICFLCPTTEEENGRKLCVHHVSYNKDCLCDDSGCEFVPLCDTCHSKTNFNRDYWEQTIMEKLEVIS